MNRTTLSLAMAAANVPEWTANADTVWRTPHRPAVFHPINDPDSIADAKLSAAAPALHFALNHLQANPNDPRAHRMALDALALIQS